MCNTYEETKYLNDSLMVCRTNFAINTAYKLLNPECRIAQNCYFLALREPLSRFDIKDVCVLSYGYGTTSDGSRQLWSADVPLYWEAAAN